MIEYLPQELLIVVFLKLPIKTVIVCTSVCKSWNSLITSPAFISTHHHHQKTQLFLRQCWANCWSNGLYELPDFYEPDDYSLRSESLDEIQHLHIRYYCSRDISFRIIGSCRGLLCLSVDRFNFANTVIIWNPMIKKSVDLDVRPRTYFLVEIIAGFGFDSRTNDFKVVILYYDLDLSTYGKRLTHLPPDLYTLSTTSWRKITDTSPPHQLSSPIIGRTVSPYQFDSSISCESQAYINDAVHWIVDKPNSKSQKQHFIMFFDMITELFGEMMLPTSLACCRIGHDYVNDMCIALFGESLSIYEYHVGYHVWNHSSCVIWSMKEYGVVESWTKQLVVTMDDGFGMIFGLRENGDLLLSSRKRELISYNPETRQIKELGIGGTGYPTYCEPFTGSLAMIKSSDDKSLKYECHGLQQA